MRKIFNVKTFTNLIFLTFAASLVYALVGIILAPTVAPSSEPVIRVKGDFVAMFLQCAFGIFAMLLPGFLKRRIRLIIPSSMLIIYAVFLHCAIYLGEIRSFYYRIPHWDTILHTFSGVALGALGFSLIGLLNKSKSLSFTLSPVFVALFAFCFAVSLGVIWEIYEFTVDSVSRGNMQKYALENGELLSGQAALADTMKDLIVDSAGALAISLIGYVSLKHKKGWLAKLELSFGENS